MTFKLCIYIYIYITPQIINMWLVFLIILKIVYILVGEVITGPEMFEWSWGINQTSFFVRNRRWRIKCICYNSKVMKLIFCLLQTGSRMHYLRLCSYFSRTSFSSESALLTIESPRIFSHYFHTASNLEQVNAGLILGLRQANERRRYFVTTSLGGWAQA